MDRYAKALLAVIAASLIGLLVRGEPQSASAQVAKLEIGRYQVVCGKHDGKDDPGVNYILKIDTATGAAWTFTRFTSKKGEYTETWTALDER